MPQIHLESVFSNDYSLLLNTIRNRLPPLCMRCCSKNHLQSARFHFLILKPKLMTLSLPNRCKEGEFCIFHRYLSAFPERSHSVSLMVTVLDKSPDSSFFNLLNFSCDNKSFFTFNMISEYDFEYTFQNLRWSHNLMVYWRQHFFLYLFEPWLRMLFPCFFFA